MGHLQIVESELRQLIASGDTDELVAWVKDRVLELYRNGQAFAESGGRPLPTAAAPARARAAAPLNLPV